MDTNTARNSAHPANVLAGQHGFQAKCFAASVYLNQIAFTLNRALLSKQDKPEETAFDKACDDDEIAKAVGDNGLPKPVELNVGDLINGHAAAFMLLRRYITESDPDTGRRPEHYRKRLISLPDAVVNAVERLTKINLANEAAEAEKLGVDFSKRKEAIITSGAEHAKLLLAEIKAPWLQQCVYWSKQETDDNIEAILNTVDGAGLNAGLELRRAADLMHAAMKKTFEAGGFARLDDSIYALTSRAQLNTAAKAMPKNAVPDAA